MAWMGKKYLVDMLWNEMFSIVIFNLMASNCIGYRRDSVFNRRRLYGAKRLAVFPWKIVDIRMEKEIELQRIATSEKEIAQKILELHFKNRWLELESKRVDSENRRNQFEEKKLDKTLKTSVIIACIIAFALICLGLLLAKGIDSLRSIANEILGKIGHSWNEEFRGNFFWLIGGLFTFASSVISEILFGIFLRPRK